ncbi:hypothetical protein [Paraprevotella clara]|uniref:hypothetical protein n=1 Tax=Paraprevotella clara TaxID=454154 RepID=UPI00300E7B9A
MKKTLLTALALLMLSAGAWADQGLKKAKELAAAYMHGNNLPEVVETAVTKRKEVPRGLPLCTFLIVEKAKDSSSYLEMIVCRQFWDTPKGGFYP